jgi:MFS family permease
MTSIPPSVPGRSRDWAPFHAIAPLVSAVAIVTAGAGLLTTKTSLELALHHVEYQAVRIIVTGYPLGFLVGCLTVRRVIGRIGHGRTFQAMALITAAATLAFVLSSNLWAWTAFRCVNGFCMASMFTVAESWINLDSGPRNRGSLLSFYMIMSTLGLAAGQSMINLGDPGGRGLFVLAAATCLLGAAPFSIGGRLRPARRMVGAAPAEPDEVFGIRRLLRAAPISVIAAVQTGMTNMTFGVMVPIYATRTGYEPGTAAALVTAFSVGGLVAQMPIGWLSDRIDRRLILAVGGGAAALCCLIVALSGPLPTTLLVLVFLLYGATTLSIYPVSIAYAGSRVESRFIVSISWRLLFIYSLGSLVAPAVSNELMARTTPSALFLFLGTGVLVVAVGALVEFFWSAAHLDEAVAVER